MKKRILSLLIGLVMLVGLLPTVAFAEGTTCDGADCAHVAMIGQTHYDTLADAITAANASTEENVVVTILKSGEYAPFTISKAGLTVETADGVTATITVANEKSVVVTNNAKDKTANNVTLRGITFVSEDGTIIISGGKCDSLTLDKCIFIGSDVEADTALYIHQPSITVTGCTFENWERGYYTCGDGDAPEKLKITNNTFTNVRVPFDGYWGKPATSVATNITFTGNTITPGTWGTSYIQLWDYAQYQHWRYSGKPNDPNTEGKSALHAVISGNTYNGDVVIYKTHCDWFSESDVTIEDTPSKVVNRKLIELDGMGTDDTALVVNKDGSPITAFNDNSQNRKIEENGKQVIYALSEGEYTVKVTHKAEGDADAIVTDIPMTVNPPEVGENTTQKLPIPPLTEAEKKVAQVGDVTYTSLHAAIEAAKAGNNKTVTLLQSVTVDEWQQIWNTDGLTIDGKGKTLTVKKVESNGNGNYLFYGARNLTVKDLNVVLEQGSGFDMYTGTLENVNITGGKYGVATGANEAKPGVTIKHCTFKNQSDSAIYTQENGSAKNTVIVDCTFDSKRAVILRSDEQFIHNTITSSGTSGVTVHENATAVVTGNTFAEDSRLKLYDTDSTIEKNKFCGNVVIDGSVGVENKISLDENYWGGRRPAEVLGEENASKFNYDDLTYYTRPTMLPADLNTYQPPVKPVLPPYIPGVILGGGASQMQRFVDVTSMDYYFDAVQWAVENGITTGTGKVTFSPDAPCTRAQAVTFLWRAMGSPRAEKAASFTDVKTDAYYADAVAWAVENGVTVGTSATTFSPDAPCTRAQIVTLLYRAIGVDSTVDAGFVDVPANAYYKDAVDWATQYKITGGTGANRFSPDATCTRGQIVTFLYRAK